MSEINNYNILKTFGKLYLSLITFHAMNGAGVVAFPAETKSTTATTSDSTSDGNADTKASGNTDTKAANNGDTAISNADSGKGDTTTAANSNTSSVSTDLGSNQVCKPNTNSCNLGESCIRFDTGKENVYTCYKNEFAFCESNEYCKNKLGSNYKFCYVPPWANALNQKKQCFTEHGIGLSCTTDIHCANTLSCVDNVCVSKDGYDFNTGTSTASSGGSDTILGINKWVFISAVSFPILIIIFCFWCWIIGRSSSKDIENQKKVRYENELKKLTMGTNDDKNGDKTPKYINPQKEIEEEVGKRGLRSLFSKKKKETEEDTGATSSAAAAAAKTESTASVDTNSKQKKKNKTLVNLSDKRTSATSTAAASTSTNTAQTKKANVKKAPVSPSQDAASNASSATNATSGKPRVVKKKAGAGAKKTKKGPASNSGNDNTNASTSSKQSSQRGLVNNASAMSSALSGQSSSYFNGVSPQLDAQSAMYYQQMYNAAAAQAVQNQYYASYMQNPYYAAAAQQNAQAYYAAAAAASQDPNAAAAMYNNYKGKTKY